MNDDDKTYQTSAITEKIQEVGKQISFYRQQRQLTIEELAAKSNIDHEVLNNIERDGWIKGFSVQQLCQIADVLEVKAYQLLISKKIFKEF